MPRFAWLGDLAVTDSLEPRSADSGLATRLLLEPIRDHAIWMDQLRLLLCELGQHDVHRMSNDAVLVTIRDRIDLGLLSIVPAEELIESLFGPPEAAASGSGAAAGSTAMPLANQPAAAQTATPRGATPSARSTEDRARLASEPTGPAPAASPAPGKSSGKGGSTRVRVDEATKTVHVTTRMAFTGPDASDAYAAAAKQQIEDCWSGTMTYKGEPYTVRVEIETAVKPGKDPVADFDQIIVDRSTKRMSQTLFGAGPGYQTPAAATDVDRPRRIAHEYGHTLGLEDDYEEVKGASVRKDPTKTSNIMAETWPDAAGVLPHPHQDHYLQILKNHGY